MLNQLVKLLLYCFFSNEFANVIFDRSLNNDFVVVGRLQRNRNSKEQSFKIIPKLSTFENSTESSRQGKMGVISYFV